MAVVGVIYEIFCLKSKISFKRDDKIVQLKCD